MARPGLMQHRKFARLARMLESEALAFGHLGILWESGYQSGDDRIGSVTDVEYLSKWKGVPGVLCNALIVSGFVDFDENGEHRIHDLFDHAPQYVQARAAREAQRNKTRVCDFCKSTYKATTTRSRFCSDGCRVAAHRSKDTIKKEASNDTVTENERNGYVALRNGNGTPSPNPLPTLSQPSPQNIPPTAVTPVDPDPVDTEPRELTYVDDEPPAKVKKLRTSATGIHAEAMKFYVDHFTEKNLKKPHVVYGRDGKAMKNIIEACEGSIAEVKSVIRKYIGNRTDWYVGHPLTKLAMEINKFRVSSDNSEEAASQKMYERCGLATESTMTDAEITEIGNEIGADYLAGRITGNIATRFTDA